MTDDAPVIPGAEIDDATSVLLLVPADVPADDEACVDLLTRAAPARSNVLSVTLSETPDERLARWKRHVGETLPKRAAVVGAGPAAAAPLSESYPLPVEVLSAPVDPAELQAVVARYLREWAANADPTFVCVHSLTALLADLDLSAVVRLVDGLHDRFASADAVAHYHLDGDAVDDAALAELRPLFDVVAEHRSGGEWSVDRSDRATPLLRGASATSAGVSGPGSNDVVGESFDALVDALAARERRLVLYSLLDDDGTTVDALAARLAASAEGPASERSARIALRHVHLPKLEAAGAVAVDDGEDVVRHTLPPELEAYVEHTRAAERGG